MFRFLRSVTGYKGLDKIRSEVIRKELEISRIKDVRQFNYLGCELSLDGEPDFDKKKNTDSKEYAALLGNIYRKPVQITK